MNGSHNQPSLFDELGGEAVLRSVIDSFVDRMFDDAMIGYFFMKADRDRIKRFEYEHAAEHLGAGTVYTGRSIRAAHGPHSIRIGHFNRRKMILQKVLAEHDAPESVVEHWMRTLDSLLHEVMGTKPQQC